MYEPHGPKPIGIVELVFGLFFQVAHESVCIVQAYVAG